MLKSNLFEKGKNYATKQDTEEITGKIESVKEDISRLSLIDEQKRQLKYAACIQALGVIDAHFSHSLEDDPVKQFVSTEEVRQVHSHLILSCDDIKIVEKFTSIICKSNSIQPTEQLNELRNLNRSELGFGDELPLDKRLTWISKIQADPSAI